MINLKIVERIQGKPCAIAHIKGGTEDSQIYGTVCFFPWSNGTIIKLEVMGLPQNNENNFWGFHIHEYGNCEEKDVNNPFESAGEHFTLDNESHPNHTGDLPMIYSNNGYSFMIYYSARFTPEDVIGKSVIIHKNFDDIVTPPSGNSGKRIACGVIIENKK